MVARKGGKEQRLRKKLRTQWDAIFERLTTDVMQLQTKWDEAMKRKVGDLEVTSDGKIFSPGWDNLGRLVTGILRGLYVLKAADGTCSREHLSSVYSEPQLSRKLEVLRHLNDVFLANMERMRNPKFLCCCYRIGCAAWESRCLKGGGGSGFGGGVAEKPYLANMQTRVRRALVLPWRRRRDIAQCLGDEPSDVVDALISDPWLTDHVYADGELDERRLVHLARIVREKDAATARAKVKRRVCASCGRRHAIFERSFAVCNCGRPHYCSVACQRNHWEAGHKISCGKSKKWRESYPGGPNFSIRFCFRIDGELWDPWGDLHLRGAGSEAETDSEPDEA